MKVLLFSPMRGQHIRNAFYALADNGLLDSYHTRTAVSDNLFFRLITEIPIFSLLKRRMYTSNYIKKIKTYWTREMGAIMLKKINLDFLFPSLYDSNKTNILFDKKVAKYIKKHANKIDAVYGYEDSCSFSFMVAKELGIKCIYELPMGYWRLKEKILLEQINLFPKWKNTLTIDKEPIDKLLRKDKELELADLIIVPSEFVKDSLSYYPGKLNNVEIVQYGAPQINPINKERNGKDKIQLLFCGALSQRKGIADICELWKILDRTKFDLTIIGRGNIGGCKPLEDFLLTTNYIPNVSHDDLLKIMSKMDVLLFPSHFEGFALVIFDAMSQGLPVLTTHVTCGPIQDGKDGWIVKPNDVQAMKNVLDRLEQNRKELMDCSLNASKTAKAHSWNLYQRKLCEKVENVMVC